MAVKQSTISIAASAIFLALAVLLGGGVWLVSTSIAQEQAAVAKQAESRQLGSDLANAQLESLSLMAAEIQRQALVMSYADCFWALTVAAIAVTPALLLLPKSKGGASMAVH